MSGRFWKRLIPSDFADAFKNLYTVTFGFTFSFMLATALDFLWGGIDLAWTVPFGEFVLRFLIIGMTLAFCGIYFYHSFSFIQSFGGTKGVLINYYEIVVSCLLSTGAWACYHLARVIAKPFSADLYPWPHPILNADVLFLLVFVPGAVLLLAMHPIVAHVQRFVNRRFFGRTD